MKKFHFGENLRIIRRQKHITQQKMADKVDISQANYSRIENQSTPPSPELVIRIANALGVEPIELMPPVDPNAVPAVPEISHRQKTKELLRTPFGKLVIVAIFLSLVPAAYALAHAFCVENKASDQTTIIVQRSAAALTIGGIWLWVWWIKRGK